MPDIYISHASLSQANEDLSQAQSQMASTLQDFVDQISPHLANTQGATKEAWNTVQTKINSTTTRAHGAMATAVQTLSQIHDDHIASDNQGASIMGG